MDYLSGEYLTHNPTWHAEDSAWKGAQILKLLRRHQLSLHTVAEIGCGAGDILCYLQRQLQEEVDFFGYDISPQAIELAKPKENQHLHFFKEDMLVKSTSFDLVLAVDVFEHVEDYFGFLRQLKTKSTYSVFHVPLDLSAQSVVRKGWLLKARRDVGHLHYFVKDTALATIQDAGFTVVDWQYTATTLDLPARSFLSSLARIPRRLLFTLWPDFTVRLLGGYSLLVLAKSS